MIFNSRTGEGCEENKLDRIFTNIKKPAWIMRAFDLKDFRLLLFNQFIALNRSKCILTNYKRIHTRVQFIKIRHAH